MIQFNLFIGDFTGIWPTIQLASEKRSLLKHSGKEVCFLLSGCKRKRASARTNGTGALVSEVCRLETLSTGGLTQFV